MKTLMTMAALASLVLGATAAKQAVAASTDVVVLNGQVIGQDPDGNIRLQLLREYDSRNGE